MSAFPKSVTAVVPAKINLALCVGGVRRDHFHELATVYQAVSLFDEVEVTRRSAGSGIRLSVEGRRRGPVPTDEGNLAWRAAQLVAAEVDVEPDVDIRITKRIPVAGDGRRLSGRRGALLACDVLWRANLHRERRLGARRRTRL